MTEPKKEKMSGTLIWIGKETKEMGTKAAKSKDLSFSAYVRMLIREAERRKK